MDYYTINKGTGKTVEFKGLRAQHLAAMAAVVILVFIAFVVLRVAGVPDGVSLGAVGGLGAAAAGYVARSSRKYGRHGLGKMQAARAVPRFILRRRSFRRMFEMI